ncbi:sugar ABC transporter substrate-binding protein [Streptomyces sp. B6B3]|uniref:ABC transporter substrate-binding protein n=1 Tax=Streptomyces sp. B6B3 TaxID=3153570 RepID=UPI00325ED204
MTRRVSLSRAHRFAAAAAVGTLLVLTGCGGGDSSDDDASGKQTLTFWGWTDMSEPVDLWNETHPDIQVNFQMITSDFFPKLQAAISGETGAPDVVQVDYPNLTSTVVDGALMDITEASGDIESHYAPAVWDQVVIDGKVWGIPQDIGTQALFYRSDLFEEAGLDAPTTWDEYRDAAATLKREHPDSFVTALPSNGGAWLASLAWNAQARWFGTSGDSWQVDIDDEATRQVAEYWQGMLDEGYVRGDQHWQPTWFRGMADGTYLTWIGPAWGGASLKENAPDLEGKWSVAPLPQWSSGDDAPVYWGGSLTALTSVTEKSDAALEFATWLNTHEDSAEILAESVLPASEEGQAVEAVNQPDPYFGDQVVNEVFTADGSSNPWVWGPTMTDTTAYLDDALQAVINGSTTLPEELADIDRRTETQMRDKGLSVQ